MKSFILITFGFLAVAFYALSGGSEFDPDALRASRVEAPALEPTPIVVATLEAAPSTVTLPQQTDVAAQPETPRVAPQSDAAIPTVTLAALSTQDGDARIEPQAASAVQSPRVSVTLPSLIPMAGPEVGAPRDPLSDAELAGTLSAEEVAALTPREAPQAVVAAAPKDLRAVTGNRVNVRAGPSTGFDIVARLTKGNDVEVLRDPGNGWVKIRPTAGGGIGWMADFLLSDSQ